MKSFIPWLCLIVTTNSQVVFANEGLDAYRRGDYDKAAVALEKERGRSSVVDDYLGQIRLYGYGQLKNNVLALRYFKDAAEKGFLPALNLMARYALLEEKDFNQALYWFKKAAAAGDTQAQMYCAAAYKFGVGVNKNSNLAKKYYIEAAKAGNSIAECTLAEHFIGSRYANDRKLGLIWLDRSFQQNNPRAQMKLGELYASGKLVTRDLAKAKELIRLAVASDYVPAMFQMGEMARQEKNWQSAKAWYLKAAKRNYGPAQMALSQLYLQPDMPFFDTHAGFLWLLRAAQGGVRDAQLDLSKLYEEGKFVIKDEHLAKEWAKQSKNTRSLADLDHAKMKALKWLSNGHATNFVSAGYQLGGIFTAWTNQNALKENNYNPHPQMEVVNRVQIFKPNFVMSMPNEIAISEYYRALATSLGHTEEGGARFPKYPLDKHGIVLTLPEQVSNSPQISEDQATLPVANATKSFDSLSLMTSVDKLSNNPFNGLINQAILGNANAQFIVAQMYQDGIHVKPNLIEAIKYYQLAADQDDLRAEYNLGLIYLRGGPEIKPDYQQGMEWLKHAAFEGNRYAQYVLGIINERGYYDKSGKMVISPNQDESIAMYYIAAARGYGAAQYRLAEILVREKPSDMSVAAKAKRNQLIKNLYTNALARGEKQAALPLAFFNAMGSNKTKQIEAFEIAKKAADQGNKQAALLLGILYDRGVGVESDHSKAWYWYQKAAINPVSAFIRGTYFVHGDMVSPDAEQGKALLQQSADAGFAYAHLNLAIMKHHSGESFLPDLDTARTLGNSKAGLLLADYYLSQANDSQKMKLAREIYLDFAEKGDKEGQLKFAFMEEQGLGGRVDLAQAKFWYEQSATQGQPMAQYLLGFMYQMGWIGQGPDYTEARKWYQQARKQYAPAAVALGFIDDTVDAHYSNALANYQMAADQKDVIGQYNLGLIYEEGKGRSVDYEKALALYLPAAEAGHKQAMVQLAALYFKGLGVDRDEQKALHWYKKSANLGDREAIYQMGLLSETGVAIKQNYELAARYYQQAADKGNVKAMLALARMYQYGLGVVKNNQQAEKIYKALAANNNPYAQYQLATFYYDGTLGERMPEKGKQLLIQAQQNGSRQARKILQWLDAQSQERLSYIESLSMRRAVNTADGPADLMYLNALNEWNRGDEELSKIILDKIMLQFPKYAPAKRAYEQLQQQLHPHIFG